MTPMLSVLANFHREGPLAFAALHSAVRAVAAADQHGIPCQIMAVVDDGDDFTTSEVARFADRLCAIYETSYANISLARCHGLERMDTKYVATLDADDLFDRDWLWKGVQFLERHGDENTVGHSQVRMSFGNQHFGRLHVGTDHPLFHPLNLVVSWHYAGDLIAPTSLYRRLPLVANDYRRGLGAEDWLWTCESLVEGVRHLIIPETAYYYRHQANYQSLGGLPWVTFAPSRLFERERVAAGYGAAAKARRRWPYWPAPVIGPKQRWLAPPAWLESSVRCACDLDLEIYDLHRKLAKVQFETPDFFPGVGQLFAHLMAELRDGRELVVCIGDRVTALSVGVLREFLAAQRGSPELDLVVLLLAPAPRALDDLAAATVGQGSRLRILDLSGAQAVRRVDRRVQHELLVRFVLQARPALVVNLEGKYGDGLVAAFGRALRSGGTRLVRLCCEHGDDETSSRLAHWRLVDRVPAGYSTLLCGSRAMAEWLRRVAPDSGKGVRGCGDGSGSEPAAFARALHALLTGSDEPKPEAVDDGGLAAAAPPLQPRDAGPVREPDVTCVLTLGPDDLRVGEVGRGLGALLAEAREHGVTVECVVVAKRPEAETTAALARLGGAPAGTRIIALEHEDEARARNAGIAAARGRYVAMLDGATLLSPSWLVRALRLAEREGGEVVVHPQAIVDVGPSLCISCQPDMARPGVELRCLAVSETWSTAVLASRALFRRIGYRAGPAEAGFCLPTWQWNCDTVAANIRHRVAAETAAYRLPAKAGLGAVRLGRPPAPTLLPSRFFSDHGWLRARSAPARTLASDLVSLLPARFASQAPRLLDLLRTASHLRAAAAPPDWDDDRYWHDNPDLAALLPRSRHLSGYAHYCWQGRAQGRGPAWRPQRGASDVTAPGIAAAEPPLLPRYLDEEMRSLAETFPRLAAQGAGRLRLPRPPNLAPADAYPACFAQLAAARPTHIFATNAMLPGGAEQSLLHHIQAVGSVPTNRPLLITTAAAADRWAHRPPPCCPQVKLAHLAAGLDEEQSIDLLARLLLNSGARCLHLFNSYLGWLTLARYAPALASELRLYVSVFSVPTVETGYDPGYARQLPAVRRHLTCVFTDNSPAAEALAGRSGVPRDRIVVVRHPVVAKARFAPPPADGKRVLWAGRIDADKRPELLLKIARRLPDWSFEVYGTSVLDRGGELVRLRASRNVRYCGPFASFDEIPDAPYRCFLYTSVWDGMPNVLLEAMRAGLLVVAPAVGGIPDLVTPTTGVLISSVDSPDAYVAALRRMAILPEQHVRLALAGQARVQREFTAQAFLSALAPVPGYLRP